MIVNPDWLKLLNSEEIFNIKIKDTNLFICFK